MEAILLIIRLFLFGVFALAGIGKLLDLEGAEKSVKAFGTPDDLAKTFAIALPFAEIVFAVCFLFTGTSWLGGIGALILLLSFLGGMIWHLSQGNAPDCHCFGQIHSEPVGKKSLIRNIVFAMLALFLLAQGRANQGTSLADNSEMMQTVLIIFVLTALIVVVFYLKKMLASQAEIIKRLDVMELISSDGAAVQRDDAGDPNDGLPIGSPFPDFDLPDVGGRRVSFENLLVNAKPLLFLFVSPTCNPCKALLPEIETWRRELDGKVNFVILSSGTPEENTDKFGGESAKAILLQKKREVADMVNAKWTPTALFVGRDGNIASHLAAGDSAIRELVEKIKAEKLDRDFVYFANGGGRGKTKIGASVPEFSLEDTKGREFTADNFKDKNTLVVFWSLTCGHCQKMMDELLAWDEAKTANDPNLIVFSEGSKDKHLELGLKSPILLESGYKIAGELGMSGTPSAVVVNEKGEIVTETAIGAAKIWALIGKRN